MSKIIVGRILVVLTLLCHLSIAQLLGLSLPEIVPGLKCLVGRDDNCRELPDGTAPFLIKMCSKEGPKEIDCREVLKNIDPVGTKNDAYCTISSKETLGPICVFNGAEYSVNDKNEVKFEASGARTAVATASSNLSFATATNYGSKTTHIPAPTMTFFSNTTIFSEGSINDDDATRTTDASTITTSSSSMETVLRSTKDVTVTIPPPAASTAANAPLRSASPARGSLKASGVVGTLVVAFLIEICFLVSFDMD